MIDDIKWNDPPKPTEMALEGVGRLSLVNGLWVAHRDGRKYLITQEEGIVVMTEVIDTEK